MACETWQGKIDAYADAELSAEETRRFDAHLRDCSSCATDLVNRMQLKRAMHIAGKRFTPSPELRRRVQAGLPKKRSQAWFWIWAPRLAVTAAVILVVTA